MQGVLVTLSNGSLDTAIVPESFYRLQVIWGHGLLGADFALDQDLGYVFLRPRVSLWSITRFDLASWPRRCNQDSLIFAATAIREGT